MGYIQFLAWLTRAGIRIAQPVAKRAFDAWVKSNKKLPTKKNFTQIANSAKNIAKPDKLAEIRSKMAAAQKVREQNKILPFRYKKSFKQELDEMKPTTVEDFIKKGDWDPSGMASGGIAGQLHLNQGGRARFQGGMSADYDLTGMRDPFQPSQEGVIPGFTKLKDPSGFPGTYNEFMYRGPDGQTYGAQTYSSISAGMYPNIYDPNKASTNVPGTPIVPTQRLGNVKESPSGELVFRDEVLSEDLAQTPVAEDKGLLSRAVEGATGIGEKVFSGPAFDKYSAERTRAYTESPSRLQYNLDANKAAGQFIQDKTKELLGDNIVSKGIGALGTFASVPLAAAITPFHEAVQVVKEGRMEPGSGIKGFTEAFLKEKPLLTAAQRAGGVLQSVPVLGEGASNIGAGLYNLLHPGATTEQIARSSQYADPRMQAAQAKGYDPRMGRTYAENIQAMGDPRMRGAKGGLSHILGV